MPQDDPYAAIVDGGAKPQKSSKRDKGTWRVLADFTKSQGFDHGDGFDSSGKRHNPGSRHYSGEALDVRIHGKTPAQVDEFIRKARAAGFDALDEREDPRKKDPSRKWGGAHVHLSLKLDSLGGDAGDDPYAAIVGESAPRNSTSRLWETAKGAARQYVGASTPTNPKPQPKGVPASGLRPGTGGFQDDQGNDGRALGVRGFEGAKAGANVSQNVSQANPKAAPEMRPRKSAPNAKPYDLVGSVINPYGGPKAKPEQTWEKATPEQIYDLARTNRVKEGGVPVKVTAYGRTETFMVSPQTAETIKIRQRGKATEDFSAKNVLAKGNRFTEDIKEVATDNRLVNTVAALEKIGPSPFKKMGEKGLTGHVAGAVGGALANVPDVMTDVVAQLTPDMTPEQRVRSGLNIILKTVPVDIGPIAKSVYKAVPAGAKQWLKTVGDKLGRALGGKPIPPQEVHRIIQDFDVGGKPNADALEFVRTGKVPQPVPVNAPDAPPVKDSLTTPKAKEPWMMTREEVRSGLDKELTPQEGDRPIIAALKQLGLMDAMRKGASYDDLLSRANVEWAHAVEKAMAEGKPVPESIKREWMEWTKRDEHRLSPPEKGVWFADQRRAELEARLAKGEQFPAEVLADYPDLQAKYAKPETPPATQPKAGGAEGAKVEEAANKAQVQNAPETALPSNAHQISDPLRIVSPTVSSKNVRTPAGSLSAGALKSRAPSSLWFHQGDPTFIHFDAKVTVGGVAPREEAITLAANVKEATRRGFRFTNYRAGKYGTVWVLEKDGDILTRDGLESMSKVESQPFRPSDIEGGGTFGARLTSYAQEFVKWKRTLKSDNQASISRMINAGALPWARLHDDGRGTVKLIFLNEAGDLDLQFVGKSASEVYKKAEDAAEHGALFGSVDDLERARAAKYATPPKPPAPPKTPETPGGGQGTGIPEGGRTTSHADTDAVRTLTGWDARESTPEKIGEWVKGAKAHKGKESAIADSIIQNPRQATKTEEAALGIKLNQLLDEMDKHQAAGDTQAFDLANSEANKIADALDTSGSEWGRQGVARQIVLKNDYTSFGLKRRAVKAVEGGQLPKGAAQKLEEQAKRIEELERKLAESVRKKEGSPLRPARGTVEDIRARRADALERLKASGGKAVAEIASAPVNTVLGVGGGGSGGRYTAEAFTALVDLAGTYVDEGILNAKQLAAKLKGHGLGGFNERDYAQAAKDAIGNRGRTMNRGRVAYGEDVIAAGKWAAQDPEIAEIRFQLDKAKIEADYEIQKLTPKTTGDRITEIVNAPRALQASSDLSASLRQGLILSIAHPGKALKANAKALRALFSSGYAERANFALRDRALFPTGEKSGLYLAKPDGSLNGAEEAFIGRIVKKIPVLREIVAASERHYTTVLNQLRADVFDDFARRHPNASKDALADWARFINATSGRGQLGNKGADQMLTYLSSVFYSPRYAVSRFQTMGYTAKALATMHKSPASRAIIGDVAKFAVTGYTALKLLEAQGYTVDWDPKSTGFLKAKDGKTSYDVLGGFGGAIRDIVRFTVGQKVTASGERNVPPSQTLGDFLVGKSSPGARAVYQLGTGEELAPVSKSISRPQTMWEAFMPLVAQDFEKEIRRYGGVAGTKRALPAILGIGVNEADDDALKMFPN